MINKNFIADTDTLIKQIRARGIRFEHGNVLVAKVKADRITKGGIHLTESATHVEEFKTGFARVLALPSDYGSGPLKVGQYVMFSHEARYYPYPASLSEVLGLEIIKEFLYTVQDNNVILTIEAETLHETAINSNPSD